MRNFISFLKHLFIDPIKIFEPGDSGAFTGPFLVNLTVRPFIFLLGISVLGFINSQTKSNPLLFFISAAMITLASLLFANSITSVYKRFRRYYRTQFFLHRLSENFRVNFNRSFESFYLSEYTIGVSNRNELNGIILQTINDIRNLYLIMLFGRARGIRQSCVVQIFCPTYAAGKPARLTTGFFSKHYNERTRARWEFKRDLELNRKKKPFYVSVNPEKSLIGYCFFTGSTMLVHDFKRVDPELLDLDPENTYGEKTFEFVRSAILVPIIVKKKIRFVLSIDSDIPNKFHVDHVDTARFCAEFLGILFDFVTLVPDIGIELPEKQSHAHS